MIEWADNVSTVVGLAAGPAGWAGVAGKKTAKGTFKAVIKRLCFIAGTLVVTADGLRPIEELKPGDQVLSRDEETGEILYSEVVDTFVTDLRQVLELRLVHEDGRQTSLGVTPEHPFFVVDRGWAAAEDLSRGDELFTALGGRLRVAGVEVLSEAATVYNFEVARTHTYFVGETEAWVHNTCHRRRPRVASGGGDNGVAAYRAVSRAEAEDIAKHGFRPDPSGRGFQEGKWFSESREGAETFRRTSSDLDEVVRTNVPRSVYDRSLRNSNIDGTGPGFCVRCSDLPLLPKP